MEVPANLHCEGVQGAEQNANKCHPPPSAFAGPRGRLFRRLMLPHRGSLLRRWHLDFRSLLTTSARHRHHGQYTRCPRTLCRTTAACGSATYLEHGRCGSSALRCSQIALECAAWRASSARDTAVTGTPVSTYVVHLSQSCDQPQDALSVRSTDVQRPCKAMLVSVVHSIVNVRQSALHVHTDAVAGSGVIQFCTHVAGGINLHVVLQPAGEAVLTSHCRSLPVGEGNLIANRASGQRGSLQHVHHRRGRRWPVHRPILPLSPLSIRIPCNPCTPGPSIPPSHNRPHMANPQMTAKA